MCKKCDMLLKVPVGEKRIVVLEDSDSTYGAKVDETIMFLNNYGYKIESFITHKIVLENDRNYGCVINIEYCPFCGENLIKSNS